jgi:hypothetical protein
MFRALEIAAYWDKKLEERFPTTFNLLLSTGYFCTPSARMTDDGEIGFGVAHLPPYLHWNGRIQLYRQLEISTNYRIFRHFKDPALGRFGFGNHADRGANLKFALFTPEQTAYRFPGVAIGVDDFLGTKKFTAYYLVGTYVCPKYGMEGSLGWGRGRYSRGPSQGFFGGLNWFPNWKSFCEWKRGFVLSMELDPTNYDKDPHPRRVISHSAFNFGAKYKFKNLLEFSGAYLRGDTFAAEASIHYNWGKTEGFIPKIKDPLPYCAPVDQQPLGCYRSEDVMIQSLNYSLEDQGFQLTNAWLEKEGDTYRLTLRLFNFRYRQEHITRMRLQYLLAALAPLNVSEIVVILESYGLPCQKYVYNVDLLKSFASQSMTPYEFDLLSPRLDPAPPSRNSTMIFQRRSDLWHTRISPRIETFMGNARGKFKYSLGLKACIEGFLPLNWYYEFQASFTAFSSLKHIADFDLFHPSQLPNVATDYIRYRQAGAFTWDMIYLQKTWTWPKGFFSRLAAGYFQVNYGGVAGEVLWYPAQFRFAIGLEGAIVKKRDYRGFGFQSTLRHFKGKMPVFVPYSTLQQYFLNFYIDFPTLHTFTKIGVGQFLARDKGVRIDLTRYFDNGFRLTGWVTFTNAGDMVHGKIYYDKGIAIEIPFDFFYRTSSRRVWNYASAAWLRDAGYATFAGKPLFEIINRERRW